MPNINVKLILDDICNPSNQDAVHYVTEILNEVFGREERQEYPRVKLILMEVTHGSDYRLRQRDAKH